MQIQNHGRWRSAEGDRLLWFLSLGLLECFSLFIFLLLLFLPSFFFFSFLLLLLFLLFSEDRLSLLKRHISPYSISSVSSPCTFFQGSTQKKSGLFSPLSCLLLCSQKALHVSSCISSGRYLAHSYLLTLSVTFGQSVRSPRVSKSRPIFFWAFLTFFLCSFYLLLAFSMKQSKQYFWEEAGRAAYSGNTLILDEKSSSFYSVDSCRSPFYSLDIQNYLHETLQTLFQLFMSLLDDVHLVIEQFFGGGASLAKHVQEARLIVEQVYIFLPACLVVDDVLSSMQGQESPKGRPVLSFLVLALGPPRFLFFGLQLYDHLRKGAELVVGGQLLEDGVVLKGRLTLTPLESATHLVALYQNLLENSYVALALLPLSLFLLVVEIVHVILEHILFVSLLQDFETGVQQEQVGDLVVLAIRVQSFHFSQHFIELFFGLFQFVTLIVAFFFLESLDIIIENPFLFSDGLDTIPPAVMLQTELGELFPLDTRAYMVFSEERDEGLSLERECFVLVLDRSRLAILGVRVGLALGRLFGHLLRLFLLQVGLQLRRHLPHTLLQTSIVVEGLPVRGLEFLPLALVLPFFLCLQTVWFLPGALLGVVVVVVTESIAGGVFGPLLVQTSHIYSIIDYIMYHHPLTRVDDLFSLDIPLPYKQDMLYHNTLALLTAKRVAAAQAHVGTPLWNDSDDETRDILFGGSFPQEKESPNMFMYTQSHLQERRSMSSSMKYQQLLKECKKRKHLFLFRSNHTIPLDESTVAAQTIFQEHIRAYLLPAQITSLAFVLSLRRIWKLHTNPLAFTAFAALSGLCFSTFFAYYKFSDRIFQGLPPLPHPAFEQERQDIINYCMPLDIEMVANSIDSWDKAQRDQARKERDQE